MDNNLILNNIKQTATKLISFKTYRGNTLAFIDLFKYVKKMFNNFNLEEIIVNYDGIDNYNLVISNCKGNDFDIIFCCHIDVVSDKEYRAYEKDGCLFGRGAIDMKGQTAVVMELLRTVDTNKKIALILTSDEENGGFSCEKIMEKYNSKLAVIPDGGSNFDLIIEEKGVLQIELTSIGISAHGSEPFKGDNAILKLMNLYNDLIKKYPMPNRDEYKLSITLSKIIGGDANNKVPDFAKMNLDIRFTRDDNINKVLEYINNYSKDISVKILDLEPVFYVDEKLKIIQEYINNCNKILNRKICLKKCCAGSDAPYFSKKGIPVIMMNPIGNNWHADNEFVNIDSLYKLYLIFKTLL